MRRNVLICVLVLDLVLSWGMVWAEDFYVIPVAKKNHAPVEKTGQTNCWDSLGVTIFCTGTGQDGEYKKGVAWPTPRFTDNSDGTVTDNLTGLIWLKNANCPDGVKNWSDALRFANSLYDGWDDDPDGGDCDLSDGSQARDWRLANVKELQSLIDYGNWYNALPSGHPFKGVQSDLYWSSTTLADLPDFAWSVDLGYGGAGRDQKAGDHYVWPVRGGQ